MGLRFRKSIGSGPFKVNISKSGIGYSFGGKGFRYTKKAGGGFRTTTSIPGTGISYTKDHISKKTGGSMKKTKNVSTVPNKSQMQAPQLQTLTLSVAGLNLFADNLKKIAKLNPDWNLSPEEILVAGKDSQKIFQCKFINAPVALTPVSDYSEDPNAIAVLIAGYQIGYLENSSSAKVRKLLKSRKITSVNCGIFGGKYKIVDESGTATQKRSPIKAAVKITYSSDTPQSSATQQPISAKSKKNKKPVHKRWWFWLLILGILLGRCNGNGEDTSPDSIPIETVVSSFASERTETTNLPTETVISTTTILETETISLPAEPAVSEAEPIHTVVTETYTESSAQVSTAIVPIVPIETAPPIEISQTETIKTEPQGTLYILNKNTKKFHEEYCRYVDDIAPHNREDFIGNRDAVIARNFVPCKVCAP